MKIKSIFTAPILFILITLFLIAPGHADSEESIYIKVDLWSNELLVIENNEVIKRYPIAPGTECSPTPIGIFTVTGKSKSWGGGFGTRWLGLSVPWGSYGIHGTNKPKLIGENVSSGCIRMRNEDVEALFELIPEGAIVHIEGPITGMGEGEFKNLSCWIKGKPSHTRARKVKRHGLISRTH